MENNKKTKVDLSDIKKYLQDKYGEVKPEWKTILLLLSDNLELYNECKRSVEVNGIYDYSSGRKNPLLSTMKDLQATIMKQIQHLGLSPYAVSKIKDDKEDDTEDFIDSLTD